MTNSISEIILFDKTDTSFDDMQFPWDFISNISNLFTGHSSDFKEYKNVIINEENGPVIINDNVDIQPFTVLNGPLFVGKNCLIKSHSTISNSIINHDCKISGEVHSSIFQPYSNKAHEGFLGHSFVGSWVNLGAGTTTSNLKNNYSNVSVKWGEDLVNTGSIFFGSVIGDHVKTAIGTNLNTGTVIGMGSNIVSQSFPPRNIPPFSLYYKGKIIKISFDDFCETATKAMSRRGKSLSEQEKDRLYNIYKTC
ncbi:MAG: hypothetical protein VYA20_01190 [Candidatus Neomarinimicrobiota bacterium]|nr:hypothetical protein [Candidatus Neomarinimicrobiota bacterium]